MDKLNLKSKLSSVNIVKDLYPCKKCKGTGYILTEKGAKKCDCKAKGKKLPFIYQNISTKDFLLKYYSKEIVPNSNGKTYLDRAKNVLESAKVFVNDIINQNETKGFFLTGPVGSGKTFLVSGMYNDLIKKGIDAKFLIVPDFLENLRNDLFKDNNRNILEESKKKKVLFLDDLGAHNYSSWVIQQLYSLLNYRLINGLPTVITTNLALNEMKSYLEERVTSRIYEMCKFYLLDRDKDIRIQSRSV